MGKKAGIPCIECDYRFTDDTPAGRHRCPNCSTEYRMLVDPVSKEKEMVLYSPLTSNVSRKTPDILVRKSDETTKKEALTLQALLPKDGECNFCRKVLTFATSVKVKIKSGKIWVEKKSTDFTLFKSGESQVDHTSQMVPLPESVAVKTKNVNVCPDCVTNPAVIKVLPAEYNTVTDKWSKKTGARKQHYSRQVPEGTRQEPLLRTYVDEGAKTVSISIPYVERINVRKESE